MIGKQDVLDCFSGLSERDLSNWAGHSAFLRLWHSRSGTERDALARAVGEIIEESDDGKIVADLIHLVTVLRITQAYPSIDRLKSSGRFLGDTVVQEMLAYNSGVRQP